MEKRQLEVPLLDLLCHLDWVVGQAEQEEKGVELEKTYTSLQQEVEVKTRKLRKLFAKLQTVKQVALLLKSVFFNKISPNNFLFG